MLEELFGVNAFVLGVRIGEMITDVPQGQSAKEGVTNHVEQHIRIAVPNCPMGMGDFNAAQPEGFPFCQLVHIVTVTDSKRHGRSRRFPWPVPNLRTATAR